MKNIYPLILVFCATLALNSCRENCCGVVDTNVTVVVKDQKGNNLLNDASTGHYETASVKLFSVNNGVRSELVNKVGGTIFQFTSEHGGALTFNADAGSNDGQVSKVVIQWQPNNEDTIESTIERGNKKGKHCSHVKCNGKPKYDQSNGTARVIEIIKP